MRGERKGRAGHEYLWKTAALESKRPCLNGSFALLQYNSNVTVCALWLENNIWLLNIGFGKESVGCRDPREWMLASQIFRDIWSSCAWARSLPEFPIPGKERLHGRTSSLRKKTLRASNFTDMWLGHRNCFDKLLAVRIFTLLVALGHTLENLWLVPPRKPRRGLGVIFVNNSRAQRLPEGLNSRRGWWQCKRDIFCRKSNDISIWTCLFPTAYGWCEYIFKILNNSPDPHSPHPCWLKFFFFVCYPHDMQFVPTVTPQSLFRFLSYQKLGRTTISHKREMFGS